MSCWVEDRDAKYAYGMYELEVDFLDTVKSNQGSYCIRLTSPEDLQCKLSEIEAICKEN